MEKSNDGRYPNRLSLFQNKSTLQIALALFLTVVSLMLTGCRPWNQSPTENLTPNGQSIETVAPQPVVINLKAVPMPDISQHIVPLEEIYFDTFRRTNRTVPLSKAETELIVQLRDAIPPIYNPKFEPATTADDWLTERDLVVGYVDGGEAYAYPIRLLNWHEMVSHTVNGRPILATY